MGPAPPPDRHGANRRHAVAWAGVRGINHRRQSGRRVPC